MKLTITRTQEILSRHYPSLLLDSVKEVTPGECVIVKKSVTVNEQVFRGYFPGDPALPGALIIESLARAGAMILLSMPEFKEKTAYFGGLDKAKFRQRVTPGNTLILEVELSEVRISAEMGKGVTRANEKKVAEVKLTLITG